MTCTHVTIVKYFIFVWNYVWFEYFFDLKTFFFIFWIFFLSLESISRAVSPIMYLITVAWCKFNRFHFEIRLACPGAGKRSSSASNCFINIVSCSVGCGLSTNVKRGKELYYFIICVRPFFYCFSDFFFIFPVFLILMWCLRWKSCCPLRSWAWEMLISTKVCWLAKL